MEFNPPVVTALVAASILVLQLFLMFRVGVRRGATGLSLGVGDDPDTLRIIRRHANLAENAGIFMVVLGLLELLGGARTAVIALGIVFLIGRIAHAIGMSVKETRNAGRIIGALGTLGSGLGMSGYLAFMALTASQT